MKSPTSKSYFPFLFDITHKLWLVVGGGKVAERKIKTILKFKGRVKCVSPKAVKGIRNLAERGKIELEQREYKVEDLEGIDFLVVATNDNSLNESISRDAKAKRIPTNVVDSPSLCDFVMPSIIKRGDLILAISTSGRLPILSKKLRLDLEKEIGRRYMSYLTKVSKLREELKREVKDPSARQRILRRLLSFEVHDVARMDLKEIKRLILRSQNE